MKRLISVIVFILIGTVLAEGEEMKFVTVLSSPVGTFAQLETANPTRAVKSPVVNFGTSRVTVGRMELKGAAGYIEDLSLQSGTELGGNAGAYRVAEGMEVGSGGRITGGRLMANEVNFSGALEGRSEVKGSLYIDEIAVAGAKADSLTIPDEVELTASSGEEEVLEWSNEYICDYEKGTSDESEETQEIGLNVGQWTNECYSTSDCNNNFRDAMTDQEIEAWANAHSQSKTVSCTDYKLCTPSELKGGYSCNTNGISENTVEDTGRWWSSNCPSTGHGVNMRNSWDTQLKTYGKWLNGHLSLSYFPEGLVISCQRKNSAGKWDQFFRYYRANCRKISYRSPYADCKPTSTARYDSYLLKSKSTNGK